MQSIAPPPLSFSTVLRRQLSQEARDEMWRLYVSHYENVDRATFCADLEEKQEVFLGRDRVTGDIVGFSTAILYNHRYRGRDLGVYFSGDTIIHPDYWGQTAFHSCVTQRLARWKLRHPFTPLYWFLICSGYRTYLTMARNVPDHYPHFRHGCPDWERGLIDELSRSRYGDAYRAQQGVIRFDGAQVRLRPAIAPFTHEVTQLEEVAFFLDANPGCHDGDELAVIGRINLKTFRHVAVRFVAKALRRWRRSLGGSPRPAAALSAAALSAARLPRPEPP